MEELKREAFVFYRSYYDALQNLSEEDRLVAYEAIFQYALDGTEPEVAGVPAAVFMLVKPTLKASRGKAASGSAGGKSEANGKQTGSKAEAKNKQTGSKPEAEAKQSGSKSEANGKQTASKAEAIKDKGLRIKDKVYIYTPPLPPTGEGTHSDEGEEREEEPPVEDEEQEAQFAEFWNAYPKKVGEKACRNAWKKLNPSKELHEMILSAIALQKKSEQWTRDGGRFIPNPRRWLEEERWKDKPSAMGGNAPPGRPEEFRSFDANEFFVTALAQIDREMMEARTNAYTV